MKKILLLSLVLIACNKGDEAAPAAPATVQAESLYHNLVVKDNTHLTTNLYINGVYQPSINDTIIVKSGDAIQVVNVGEDTWVGNTKTDSYVSVQVFLDGETIFNVSCTCDVRFNKIIK